MATQKLGIYLLERQIGKGGMGSVYLAHDPTLKRRVAIKVLPARLAADPDYVARFEREATTLAQIRHPNLMHIYAVGKDRGLHYIAMEYIQGRNLAERLRDAGPLPLPEAVRILSQVLAALEKVHAVGVVHRDLKPANILMDEDERAVLMDFGLAKPRYDRSVTTDNLLLGTPEYMAPELAEGAEADFRSEIYALGIILFEMLAGKVPFRASSAIATLREHVEKPLPPVSRLRPDLPKQLDAILARALAKKPEQRYPDVRSFAADLLPLAGPLPTTVTVPIGTGAPPAETAATLAMGAGSRTPWLYAGAGAAVVLVLLLIGVLVWPGRKGKAERRAATGTSSSAEMKSAASTSGGLAASVTPRPAPKGFPCSLLVRRGGVVPERLYGRLLAVEGEGGSVQLETGTGIVKIPYADVLRIQPEGGR
jgi:serine/threonine-protein kinase